MSGFNYEKDNDGIVTVTMDLTGPVNVLGKEYDRAMNETLERLEAESGLIGVVFTSAKKTFFAGGDLKQLVIVTEAIPEFEDAEQIKAKFRQLEKLEVPVVAAINGAALGGGYEICSACNYRVVVNDPKAVVGLPEVTLGLLPGAGGLVRTIHRLGFDKAMPIILAGRPHKPAQALSAGLVDEIVKTREELVSAAKAWIKTNPDAWQQPWDKKGHKIPGVSDLWTKDAQKLTVLTVQTFKKTRGLLPAPERILAVAGECLVVDFDTALREESRGLAYLAATPESSNIINTMFFQMNQIKGGSSRPEGIAQSSVKKVGILGAGMMGQGIAYESAMAGIEVVLKDITMAVAEKGKSHCEKLLGKLVEKGRMDEVKKQSVLDLIKPTTSNEDLAGCDLIVESVFENITLKHSVIRATEPLLAENGVYASNTSMLPITQLAEASEKAANFIGIHFFSPVDRMPLVELICGEKTSDETLARAFDYARQIGKTPIVVNDSLGFYTSRTFETFLDEAARLLEEGLDPVLIENFSKQVGMPIGPLAIQDEVSQELAHKMAQGQREMGIFGSKSDNSHGVALSERLISEFNRGGRYHGGGYYEYPEDGPKHIWPKLYELFHRPEVSIPEQDIKDRIIIRQSLETVKCLQENVLRSVADGNVGSVLGIGAPTWTGGWLQVINTYNGQGVKAFAARAAELAEKYGERFEPPALLLEKVEKGELFE